MDSISIHFKNSNFEDIEAFGAQYGMDDECCSREINDVLCTFYYSNGENTCDFWEEQLKLSLFKMLDGEPDATICISTRHGESARFALDVVVKLMKKFSPSVLHDDYGNLWQVSEVKECLEESIKNTIFTLRNWR